MGELAVLDYTGDTKTIWDKNKPDEVEAARTTFNALKKKKYAAFKVSKDGSQGDQIQEFDASLEMIIMVPALVGG